MTTDPMSMSLDALIEKNKTKSPGRGKGRFNGRGRGRGGRGRGRGRGRGGFRSGRGRFIHKGTPDMTTKRRASNKRQNTPLISKSKRNSLKPLTSKHKKEKLFTGALVEIDPLNPDILESDIRELCGKIGEVRSIKMSNSRRVETRSKGAMFKRAVIRFRNKNDADTAVNKLNRRALDDTVMNVSIINK